MLDYRFHYAVMAAEDRLRRHPQPVINRRGARRIFRLNERAGSRDGSRR